MLSKFLAAGCHLNYFGLQQANLKRPKQRECIQHRITSRIFPKRKALHSIGNEVDSAISCQVIGLYQ